MCLFQKLKPQSSKIVSDHCIILSCGLDVTERMTVTSAQDFSGCHVLLIEDLRSIKSYVWPLFNFHPKLFPRKRTFLSFYLLWCTKFPSFPFFGCLNRLYQGLFVYPLSVVCNRILVLSYWADVVKLRVFQPQGSDEMFTVLFYKSKNKKFLVIIQHL